MSLRTVCSALFRQPGSARERRGQTERADGGADPRARRRVGDDAAAGRARGRRLPRGALRRAPEGGRRRPGSAEPDPPGRRPRHPPAVPRRGCGHHDDEHLHGDADRPGRLRARGRGSRPERRGRSAGAAGRGRGRRPLRRRLARAAERDPFALPEGRRSRLPPRHLRPGRRGVRGADRGPPRGRRRLASDRDDLRHAERQGGDRGRARRCAGAAALDLGDDRRPVRQDALRPDGRGVLDRDRAREAVRRRRQLLARRQGDAAARRRAGADRDDATRAATRTPACRTPSAATTSVRTTRLACCAPSRQRASSTSSAAAAARRPTTSGRSRPPSRDSPPDRSRNARRVRASAAWSHSRSGRTPASSWSASARTSPARPASGG